MLLQWAYGFCARQARLVSTTSRPFQDHRITAVRRVSRALEDGSERAGQRLQLGEFHTGERTRIRSQIAGEPEQRFFARWNGGGDWLPQREAHRQFGFVPVGPHPAESRTP